MILVARNIRYVRICTVVPSGRGVNYNKCKWLVDLQCGVFVLCTCRCWLLASQLLVRLRGARYWRLSRLGMLISFFAKVDYCFEKIQFFRLSNLGIAISLLRGLICNVPRAMNRFCSHVGGRSLYVWKQFVDMYEWAVKLFLFVSGVIICSELVPIWSICF